VGITRREFAARLSLGVGALALGAPGRGQEPERCGIVVAADVHLKPDEPRSGRSFMRFVEDVNDNLPDARYVLLLGDLMDWGTDESYALMAELQAELRPRVLGVPGNHDFRPRLAGDETGRRTDDHSMEYFVERFAYAPGPYYSFALGNTRFVMMATERCHSNPEEVSYGGWVSTEQREWLDGQLSRAESAGENVIVCSHQGIFERAWNTHTLPYCMNPPEPLAEVLEAHPIDVSLSGHVHGQLQEHHGEMVEERDGTVWINGGALSHARDGRMQCRYFELVDGAPGITIRSRDVADVRSTPEAEHPVGCFIEGLDVDVPLRHGVRLTGA
jgi:3',5'-cyclic AMP phosphodiesterase CpdA